MEDAHYRDAYKKYINKNKLIPDEDLPEDVKKVITGSKTGGSNTSTGIKKQFVLKKDEENYTNTDEKFNLKIDKEDYTPETGLVFPHIL